MSTTNQRTTDGTDLDPAAVRSLIERNPDTVLVDVRTPGEYATAHIAGSVNLPLDRLDAHAERIVRESDAHLVLVCQAGGRASQAQEKLSRAGMTGTTVLAGGMNAWLGADAPVVRAEQERWGLERQVRLVAGSIVLLSVIASIWLPVLRFVAGAVGAGLVFAATTNSCMMGMLLAKLPYNRGPGVDVDGALARIAGTREARQ